MATRSTIALEYADGTVEQVYCHWDGYIGFNGRILMENYSDPFKLQRLIDHGDISSLGPEIGERRPFSPAYGEKNPDAKALIDRAYEAANQAGWCTFYGRDRGEEGVGAKKFGDFDLYRLTAQLEEYNYILRTDGKWYVRTKKDYVELAPLVESETV